MSIFSFFSGLFWNLQVASGWIFCRRRKGVAFIASGFHRNHVSHDNCWVFDWSREKTTSSGPDSYAASGECEEPSRQKKREEVKNLVAQQQLPMWLQETHVFWLSTSDKENICTYIHVEVFYLHMWTHTCTYISGYATEKGYSQWLELFSCLDRCQYTLYISVAYCCRNQFRWRTGCVCSSQWWSCAAVEACSPLRNTDEPADRSSG